MQLSGKLLIKEKTVLTEVITLSKSKISIETEVERALQQGHGPGGKGQSRTGAAVPDRWILSCKRKQVLH